MPVTVTKEIRTETAHRLLDYDGPCAHLHGHSYRWKVHVYGPVSAKSGLLIDFKYLKEILNRTLGVLDHGIILSKDDPILKLPNPAEILKASNGERGNVFIVDFNPTIENILKWKGDEIRKHLPPFVELAKLEGWETINSSGIYRPVGE